MKKISVATVFSGIGAFEFALKRLNIDHEIVFACDNGERDLDLNYEFHFNKLRTLKTIKEKKEYVDILYSSLTKKKNYVQESFTTNYQIKDNTFFQDIKLLDGRDFKNQIDILVGGSPCQSFSSVGFQAGLEDTRGTLFYEFARLIKEIKPKVFIYENVRNLLKHDNGKTWVVIKQVFDSLGYSYFFDVLNASDYGIPQTRRRLFVVGFLENVEFEFPPKKVDLKYSMKDFCEENCKIGNFQFNKEGSLLIKRIPGVIDGKYFLSPNIYKYVMSEGTKSWKQKPNINLNIARTVLKTMGNRHRAGVDNYVSFDGTQNLGSVRMLTEREAHRLMGFTDDYKIVVSRAQAYKQAGNSIVVDVLMYIINNIFKTGIFEEDYKYGNDKI